MKRAIMIPVLMAISFFALSCKTENDDIPKKNKNARLSALTVSEGILSPEFDPETTSYSVSVPNSSVDITLTGSMQDSSASNSPMSGVPQPLDVGENRLEYIVMAENGDKLTYVISVLRAALKSDARLSALTVSAGTLSPEFDPETTSYSVNVPYTTPSLILNGSLMDSAAAIDVLNGHEQAISPGNLTISLTVTAENGVKKIYSVTVDLLLPAYTEDFDSLASAGLANVSIPVNWGFCSLSGMSASTYRADDGSSIVGSIYSYGQSSSTERALGSVNSSSVGNVAFGYSYVNGTTLTVSRVGISFVYEFWRMSGTFNRDDGLDFEYSLDATSLSTGTWNAVPALSLKRNYSMGSATRLDGNLPANRTSVNGVLEGLVVAPNARIWFRWVDTDVTGNDDGNAIDDFCMLPED